MTLEDKELSNLPGMCLFRFFFCGFRRKGINSYPNHTIPQDSLAIYYQLAPIVLLATENSNFLIMNLQKREDSH